jgi:hypothetical protein
VLRQRRREARLADAGIAEDQMQAAVPASCVGERVEQLLQLARTADERSVARRSAYGQLLNRQRSTLRPGVAP